MAIEKGLEAGVHSPPHHDALVPRKQEVGFDLDIDVKVGGTNKPEAQVVTSTPDSPASPHPPLEDSVSYPEGGLQANLVVFGCWCVHLRAPAPRLQ
ncbi:hypothetical protein BP5796_11417 [Coleophoma crateriformis]|uniref:Uncharacterized protein n=1 Tax=Coleophoma crateriformis TaxID=565419 RepID=A0A3D8QIA7_9HELO|nr:hypothetical protein BP5796_11417 [Coleophoma crateriformis]